MKIDKGEYFNYINSNKDITECQKKMLKKYFEDLNKIYMDRKSNEQIITLMNNCLKHNLVTKISKIRNLFYAFFDKEFTEELIGFILKTNAKDDVIIEYVLKNKSNTAEKNKIKNICNNWSYIIEYIVLKYTKINPMTIDNLKKFKYIDVGCGSGNKTNKISKELKLNEKNVFGADISTWGPYNQKKYDHKFNFIKIKNEKIDIESNSFDFVTCILMLHHVKNLDVLLEEIKRILKPNGILLIIEHNNYDDYDNLILDILHMLYGYLYDKNNRYLSNPDYAKYYNSFMWNFILNKKNFKLIETNPLFTELSNDIRYDNLFYSFYKNIK